MRGALHVIEDDDAPLEPSEETSREKIPMPVFNAKAVEGATAPVPPGGRSALREWVNHFKGRSVAESYRGPSWITGDGVAVIVMIAGEKWVAATRSRGVVGLLTWVWNVSATNFLSLSAALPGGLPKPSPRWICDIDHEVAQAIRAQKRFFVCLATPGSTTQGPWMVADFSSAEPAAQKNRDSLETLFQLKSFGVAGARPGRRVENPSSAQSHEGGTALWRDLEGDYWTLFASGPWMEDISHSDKIRAAWATRYRKIRAAAAGCVVRNREYQEFDGKECLFGVDGAPNVGSGMFEAPIAWDLREWAAESVNWRSFAAACFGPQCDANAAHLAMLAILRNPHDCHSLLAAMMVLFPKVECVELWDGVRLHFEAALTSADVTRSGSMRPWLANDKTGTLLRTIPMDMSASRDAASTYWRQGFDLISLIDSGMHIETTDFPVPMLEVCEGLEGTKLEGTVEGGENHCRELLYEAMTARQWSIPWGARVELSLGGFVAARIFDLDGEFSVHFLDADERYFLVAAGWRSGKPAIGCPKIVHPSMDSFNEEAETTLKLVAAAIIRDFLVVEQRDSVFTARPFRRRIGGRDIRTVVYLPRVNYRKVASAAIHDVDEAQRDGRARHAVSSHLRKAAKPSAAQRFLAGRYGIELPVGFTFVRSHERGGATADAERVRVYRSRSAGRMLFEALLTAPEGTRPKWFDFEKDCAVLLRRRGLTVLHQSVHRDGDGGVDLLAVDGSGQSFVVQCKCYSKPVGPEVIRELSGAIALIDHEGAHQSIGIAMTTSSFTAGAAAAAKELGFELIDGRQIALLLAQRD